jgi:hypothetical protein
MVRGICIVYELSTYFRNISISILSNTIITMFNMLHDKLEIIKKRLFFIFHVYINNGENQKSTFNQKKT